MSAERIIRPGDARFEDIEAFAYTSVQEDMDRELEAGEEDLPLVQEMDLAEDDTTRLATVDRIVYEKLQNAERDAQDIARRAYEEGFAAGETEGRTFGESQYRAYMERLDGALRELAAAASLLDRVAQDELVALCVAMGEHLAAQQLDQTAQAIQPLLLRALEEHPHVVGEGREGESVRVYLNPRDLEQLGDRYVGQRGLRLLEDASLSRGSLRLETPQGVLDATLERRRDQLMDLLHRNLGRDGS